jgi:hypothetical protein
MPQDNRIDAEEHAAESELFELRKQILVEKKSPQEVADRYEQTLKEKGIKRLAHWEALRRLREDITIQEERAGVMPVDRMLNDSVSLLKKNGERYDEIKTSVQKDKIFTNRVDIPIEEGDIFERKLPNGLVERYLILDAGYHTGFGNIKAHYQSSVRKETKIDPPSTLPQAVYNLIGPNARVNIHSMDASNNVVDINQGELFNELILSLQKNIDNRDLKENLTRKVAELQQAQGTADFVVKYREFITMAANHMTIISPFIPALSQMLG